MKIALLAPTEERVPPKKYGGIELIISLLAEELVRRGHNVHLFASKDSITKATLHPYGFKAIRKSLSLEEQKPVRRISSEISVSEMYKSLGNDEYDIIHNHAGWEPIIFSYLARGPMVTTLHGPMNIPHRDLTYGVVKGHPFVSISDSQRKPAIGKLRFTATVYNGINVKKFRPKYTPGRYLAFLGRMSPQKGPIQAIEFAKKAGLPLIMAAKVDPFDLLWFEKNVKPHIDGKQIRFIGEVGHEGKVRLLRNAIALVALIQWEEPFGLFFVEALACGTPVITNKLGSVPEIITPKTGVMLNPKEPYNAKEAMKKISQISRKICRAHAEKHFSVKTMVDGYEKVYQKLARKNKAVLMPDFQVFKEEEVWIIS